MLAVLIVLVAWTTGGGVGARSSIAVLFFVVASAWNISRWRNRLRGSSDGHERARST